MFVKLHCCSSYLGGHVQVEPSAEAQVENHYEILSFSVQSLDLISEHHQERFTFGTLKLAVLAAVLLA